MLIRTGIAPAAARGRSWLRVLAWILGGGVLLLLAAYLALSSSFFFKAVVLPRLSGALHARITVGQASLSPFHQIRLEHLEVRTTGTEPLVTVPEVRLRYSLIDILRGNFHIQEADLVSPVVVLVENPDGTSNLDPILRSGRPSPVRRRSRPAAPARPSKPPQLEFGQLSITGASLRLVALHAGGRQSVDELTNLNLTVTGVRNAHSGHLALGAAIYVQNALPPPGTNGWAQADWTGSFDFALSENLQPASLKGGTHLNVTGAGGGLAQLTGLDTSMNCDITPTDVRQAVLQVLRNGALLGRVQASGPFALARFEGRLLVELSSVDKQLLNILGAGAGLDFGPTTIHSSNVIQVAKSGAILTVGGQFNIQPFQVTRAHQTTPALDLRARYKVTVDSSRRTAILRQFTLAGTQQGNPLLDAGLTGPMSLGWGEVTNPADNATLHLSLTNLSLADWKPLLGHLDVGGIINATAELSSRNNGRLLDFDLDSGIRNLAAAFGSNKLRQAAATLQIKGQAANLKRFNLSRVKFALAHQTQPLLQAQGSGLYDVPGQNAELQLLAQADLARWLEAFPQPNRQAPAPGPFDARLQLSAGMRKNVLDLRRLLLALTPTSRGTNQVQVRGVVDLSQPNAYEGNLKLTADSLDLTRYYDLFAGPKPSAAQSSTPPRTPASATALASQPASGVPAKAPSATPLSIRRFVAQANIGRLYLREIEITNLQATARSDTWHLAVNPMQLSLNGAPVSTTLDLDFRVPGSQYSLAFSAKSVPLAPLVDSFQPERTGLVGGTLTAQTRIKGVGTTGSSLKNSLSGQFDLTSTNLDLTIDRLQGTSIGTRLLKLLVSTIAVVPDLARNPASATTSLLRGFTGPGAGAGSVAQLDKSPINTIALRGSAGAGRVDLRQALVQSPAFEARASGTVTLADVLANSPIQIPVAVYLDHSLAERINLAGNTPTNAAYARLPDFLSIRGTLGQPKADVNKVALARAVLQRLEGKTSQGGSTLEGLGGALGGGGTNAPAGGLGGVLRGLGGMLGRPQPGAKPPNASTNQPPTNPLPAGNFLNRLFGPGNR